MVADSTCSRIEGSTLPDQNGEDLICDGVDATGGEIVITYSFSRSSTKAVLDVRLVSPDEVAVQLGTGRVSKQKLPHPVIESSQRVHNLGSCFVVKFRKNYNTFESMDTSDDFNRNSPAKPFVLNGTSHLDQSDTCPSPAKIRRVENMKSDFSENSDETLIVYMYVKGIEKDSLKVDFKLKEFSVTFDTADQKFLSTQEPQQQDGSSEFLWYVPLKAEINASKCSYKLTGTKLELKLTKRSPGRWGGFMPPPQSPQVLADPFRDARPPPVHWINASSGGDAGSVKPLPVSSPRDVTWNQKARTTSGTDPHWNTARRQDVSNNNNDSDSEPPRFLNSDGQEDDTSPVQSDDDDVPYRGIHFNTSSGVPSGMTGLDNIGNTCFMNSIVQCLANTRELRDYFLRNDYRRELNRENPLGMQGKLAVAFGSLLHVLWSGMEISVAPSKIKSILAHKASQFLGFAQHDAHEFMAFLLDGLHEDLNRVREKPYTKALENKGRPDAEVADDAWRIYKLRNDSIIVDLFQGQYRSKLICPVCNKVSITFDPFLYLSVPLPKKKKTFNVTFFPLNGTAEPFKFSVKMPADGTVCDLTAATEKLLGVRKERLRIAMVSGSIFDEFPPLKASMSSAVQRFSNASIFMYELLDETRGSFANEDLAEKDTMVEFRVTQRLAMPPEIQMCSSCRREPRKGRKLLRCRGCLRVAYCDQRCQADHWGEHHRRCKLTADLIGRPFVVSLRRSDATFCRLMHALESSARHSVDVFQPPIGEGVGELVPQGLSKDGHVSREDSCPTTPCGPISETGVASAVPGAIELPPLTTGGPAGSHSSASKQRPSSNVESPPFSPVVVLDEDNSEIVMQGLSTSTQTVLKHTRIREEVEAKVSAGVSEAASDVPEDVEVKLRRSFSSVPRVPSSLPLPSLLDHDSPSPVDPTPSLARPASHQQESPRMVAAGNPCTGPLPLDSDDDEDEGDRKADAKAAGDVQPLVRSVANDNDNDGDNRNNNTVGSEAVDVDDESSMADVGSIKSDATSCELHVKRKYPQFDVFILPRHQGARTHSKELTQILDEGGKVVDLRDRCMEIVMDWRNSQRVRGYVVVETRPFNPPFRQIQPYLDDPRMQQKKPSVEDSRYSEKSNNKSSSSSITTLRNESMDGGRDDTALRGFFSSSDGSSNSSPSTNSDDISGAFFQRRPSVLTALDDDDDEKATVNDCLQLFSEPERLSKAEAWYCSSCKQHREATKELSLWRMPNVLVLQLKRFSFKTMIFRDKIDRMIRFPVSGLDLSPYCASGEKAVYDLYGVVNHYGSMIGGHYTSYVRLCSKDDSRQSEVGWRLCDDSHVTYVDDASVVSRSAYVLFYKRRERQHSTSDVDEPLAKVPSSLLRDSLRVSPDPGAGTSTAQLSTALHEQLQQLEQQQQQQEGGKKAVESPVVTDL